MFHLQGPLVKKNNMDVAQKKQEILEDIARGPESVVFARIAICVRRIKAFVSFNNSLVS